MLLCSDGANSHLVFGEMVRVTVSAGVACEGEVAVSGLGVCDVQATKKYIEPVKLIRSRDIFAGFMMLMRRINGPLRNFARGRFVNATSL